MSTFSSFEEIDAWQESRSLVRKVRAICKRKQVERDYPFIDQITRSARSVSGNIAEGYEALTIPDFINYLGISKKSCGEVRSHLYDALDEKYVSQEEFEELAALTRKICRMIAKLIHYLQSLDPKQRRTHKGNCQTRNQKPVTSNQSS